MTEIILPIDLIVLRNEVLNNHAPQTLKLRISELHDLRTLHALLKRGIVLIETQWPFLQPLQCRIHVLADGDEVAALVYLEKGLVQHVLVYACGVEADAVEWRRCAELLQEPRGHVEGVEGFQGRDFLLSTWIWPEAPLAEWARDILRRLHLHCGGYCSRRQRFLLTQADTLSIDDRL